MSNEADTCRKYVIPALHAAGWTDDQIGEQKTFTDGRILVNGRQASRGKPKRADYLLRYRRDYMLAVVEAKAEHKSPAGGLQQAKDYAQILGLLFAYATNGHGIVEYDFTTGLEREIPAIARRGNVMELAGLFGGRQQLRAAVEEMQALLYAA